MEIEGGLREVISSHQITKFLTFLQDILPTLKVTVWRLVRDRLPTKENLKKRISLMSLKRFAAVAIRRLKIQDTYFLNVRR